jgi:predicted RND superfamily exporter protein
MTRQFRIVSFVVFGLLAAASAYYLTQLRFSFDFEQFFPRGDEDLEFFQNFVKEFESDDNFLLVAVERPEGVFHQPFLEKFHQLTLELRDLPHVKQSQSLTKFKYPVKTPFGLTSIPAIHINEPDKYESDKNKILNDERFVYNLIDPDATALVIYLKTKNGILLDEAEVLMDATTAKIDSLGIERYYMLGRPYFQRELVDMQKREVTFSAIVSAILVSFIMFFIFRRPWGIAIALFSVGLGMLLFMGLLGATGRELNAMAALYPVLMIIVGTSDVIHIMSKYIDELRKGKTQRVAIRITIKEIGLATLLTSVTTSIGFLSLVTSRVEPIRDFGINAAIGVLIAYFTVIFFTTAVLSMFKTDQIIKLGRSQRFWEQSMQWFYRYTRLNPRQITLGGALLVAFCLFGISRITTDYQIADNLPMNSKITQDFKYFEQKFAGFRPMDLAVMTKGDAKANDYEVLKEIAKVEDRLREEPSVRAISSITSVYKTLNQVYHGNRQDEYKLPDTEAEFKRFKRMAEDIPQLSTSVLLSKDQTKARISSRVLDDGAETIKDMGVRLDSWIVANTDTSVVEFRRTGTGLIIDKNAEYVRRSLLLGLGMAVLIVSLLMALLYRDLRMLLVALLPNLIPLLLAGALLGLMGIELEAGVSIVFAVIFGIAVDDTIHFLSKYKLALQKGLSQEEAMEITFTETGKAIVLTTIILFFGFLIMLFSVHPPSVIIGMLISLTLFSALFSDLFFIPVLIRKLMPGKEKEEEKAELVEA